jgi:predicted Rossmann fold flavoprotein
MGDLGMSSGYDYDVIVIGGGPSGLMACIAASGYGARVLLIDKGNKLGRKLGISGGGRCNVTNVKELDELIKFIPGNGRFLYSAFSTFNNWDIIQFFEGMGIPLKEEDNGRMFPVSDKAKTVVDALVNKVRSQGVEIRTHQPVDKVIYADGRVNGVRLMSGEVKTAPQVIVAVGGKSVPHTGSTGDGYAWALEAGHTITKLFPTEVPITSPEPWIRQRELQGLSLRDVSLTVWSSKGKKIKTHNGDMIFTHLGLSGPIALRCSQYVVKELERSHGPSVLLTIDLFPERNEEELLRDMIERLKRDPKKAFKNVIKGFLPERLIPVLLKVTGFDGDITYDHLPKLALEQWISTLKEFKVSADGTLSIEEAFVTGGGVHIKEIDPRSMESKLMPGLFFCGEVLDVHGYTGGYNITAAFTTGYTAGKHAAEQTLAVHS